MAAAAVLARRTDTAYDRMLTTVRPPDAVVVLFGDTDPAPATRLPEVTSSWILRSVVARDAQGPFR